MRPLLRLVHNPYSVAVLGVAAALLLTLPLPPLEQTPSALFFAAVMVAAWYGGLGPGLAAAGLSAVLMDYFFLPPIYSLGVGLADGVRVLVFLLVAGLISSLTAARRDLEARLREQDRRKDDFLAVLAHELRNFLAPVLNVLKVLRARGDGGGDLRQPHEIIERQVRHMSRLVDDLLDLSRVHRGKLSLAKERVDLAAVVGHSVETVRPLLEARKQRLEVAVPPGPVEVEADPMRLEQVLVNLLSNAAKYTGEGGRVGVAVRRFPGEVCVSVRDSGIGLAPEDLPYVFDLFMQAEGGSRAGLGIGLSLVRSLVEMHGGAITASSDGPGRGCEFVVRLPLPGELSLTPAPAGIKPCGNPSPSA